MFEGIYLANPNYLWLIISLPLLTGWYLFNSKKAQPVLKISSLKGFQQKTNFLGKLQPLLFILRLLSLGLIILAISRPQTMDVSTIAASISGYRKLSRKTSGRWSLRRSRASTSPLSKGVRNSIWDEQPVLDVTALMAPDLTILARLLMDPTGLLETLPASPKSFFMVYKGQ